MVLRMSAKNDTELIISSGMSLFEQLRTKQNKSIVFISNKVKLCGYALYFIEELLSKFKQKSPSKYEDICLT
jgi:hypothetical protein